DPSAEGSPTPLRRQLRGRARWPIPPATRAHLRAPAAKPAPRDGAGAGAARYDTPRRRSPAPRRAHRGPRRTRPRARTRAAVQPAPRPHRRPHRRTGRRTREAVATAERTPAKRRRDRRLRAAASAAAAPRARRPLHPRLPLAQRTVFARERAILPARQAAPQAVPRPRKRGQGERRNQRDPLEPHVELLLRPRTSARPSPPLGARPRPRDRQPGT